MNTPVYSSFFFNKAESILPALLPFLLLFSRALADMTVVLVGLMFLFLSLKNKDWQWANETWFKASLLFVFYLLIINTPLSLDPATSFGKSLAFLRWPLFAAAIAFWLLATSERLRHFSIALLLTTGFIFIDSTWQFFNGTDLFGYDKHSADRLTGPFRSPIPGTMTLRVIFILLLSCYLFSSLKQSRPKIQYSYVILALGTFLLFISGERMAFLLFILGAIIISIGLFSEFKQSRHAIGYSIISITLVLIISIWLFPDTADRTLHSILTKLEHFEQSDYGQVFSAGFSVWQQAPLFGIGLENYTQVCQQMQLTENCSHPHNVYIQIAAETGLIGLALFSAIVVTLFYQVARTSIKRQHYFLASIGLATLTASFWPLSGGISLLSNWVAALVWLGVGCSLAINNGTFNR